MQLCLAVVACPPVVELVELSASWLRLRVFRLKLAVESS
jgi:hypothetical protein